VPPSEQLEKDAGKEMAALAELIAAERFRDEASPYLMEKAAQFLDLLLKAYCRSLAGEYGIVLLENLDEAGKDAAKLFCQVWGKLPCKGELCVLAYASEDSLARLWAHLFDAVATLPPALSAAKQDPPTRNLHPALLEMARTFSLLRENFPVRQFTGLFEEGGWNPELATRTLKYFQDNGFIECAEDPLPSIKVPPPDEAPIRAFVRERLLKAAKERRFHPCFRLLEVLSKLAPANTHGLEAELGDALVLDAITADINNNTCSAIETSIQQGNFVLIVGKERAACLRYLYETNRALVQGEERDIRRVFSLESDLGTCPEYQSRVLLMQAAYKLSIHETGEALSTVKQALMQAQHSGRDLAVAYRLFSLANVSRGSLNEANEYFNFALDNAAQTRNQEELTISAFYAAAGQYLYGNISLAQRLALRACEAAAKAGRYAWVRRARFLYGRLLFETGLVQDALKIFRELFDLLPDTDEGLKAMPVLEAWIFRCGVYLNLALPRKPEKSSPDYALFCLEAALLSKTGSFSEALAQEALRSIPANDFLFIEQPDWCSGFAQVELLCNSPRAFYTRLIQVFRALSHAKTGAASPGPSPHELINQILRQDSKPRIDPLDSFYYYADYLVLSMTGAGEVDKGTALSMALNRLQTRATRIDDKEVKLNFLHTQRVNLRLWEEARRHKLV
jgi:tetratricopeptide (TPR) repeat protein